MSEKLFVLAHREKATNHVLHLLLCIPALGLWVIGWCIVATRNKRHNDKIQRQMNGVLKYRMQGMNDTDTYYRILSDEVISKRRRNQRLAVSVATMTVGLLYWLQM